MRNGLRYPIDDPRVLACKKAIARMGGLTEVGRVFGITPQAIYKWEIVPLDRVHEVALVSGLSIHELRPDIYGAKPASKRASAG